MTELQGAADLVQGAANLLVTCHVSPDGDAIGSASALATLLVEHGKKVVLYNPDPVPRGLRFLPRTGEFVRKLPAEARFDLTVVVDCGDRKLLGEKFPSPEVTGPLLVFDHHAASRPFGDVFLTDPAAASVGEILARLADELGWPLSRDAAIALYVSLVTDTGSFRYANTGAEALRLAARLVDLGVEPWAIARELGERSSLARLKLLAAALGSIELEQRGRVAVMVMTDAAVKAAGATWEDTEGLVNYARAIEGVEVSVFLATTKENKGVRVSMRSKGKVDVGAICLGFDGGGHPGAAGCLVPGTIEEVRVRTGQAVAAALTPSEGR